MKNVSAGIRAAIVAGVSAGLAFAVVVTGGDGDAVRIEATGSEGTTTTTLATTTTEAPATTTTLALEDRVTDVEKRVTVIEESTTTTAPTSETAPTTGPQPPTTTSTAPSTTTTTVPDGNVTSAEVTWNKAEEGCPPCYVSSLRAVVEVDAPIYNTVLVRFTVVEAAGTGGSDTDLEAANTGVEQRHEIEVYFPNGITNGPAESISQSVYLRESGHIDRIEGIEWAIETAEPEWRQA